MRKIRSKVDRIEELEKRVQELTAENVEKEAKILELETKLDKQLEEFTAEVRADPLLKGGFPAVGLSQGNLVLRAYIERVNDPPVRQFISVCGPNTGVATCPDNWPSSLCARCGGWASTARRSPSQTTGRTPPTSSSTSTSPASLPT